MRRVVLVFLAVLVVVALAWVIFRLPGSVSAEIGPYSVAATSPVAALAVIALFVAVYLVLRIIGFVLFLPRRLRRGQRERNRHYGNISVTRALVALAAGETADARREAGRARRLIGDTPQTLLLAAEAGRLAGQEDEAATIFRKLAEQPDAAFLGYRGLLRQAMEREDWAEATVLARQAEAAHPSAGWLRQERGALALRTGNWVDALNLADADTPKAAFAAAAAAQASDPADGLRLGRRAWKEDPSLPAAALAYATALRADGREGQAQRILRQSWQAAPHPDIAAAFLSKLPDGQSRYDAAKRLTKGNEQAAEARLLLARTALEAGKPEDAQYHADAAQATGLNQRRLWLLKAEIADADETEVGQTAHRDALRKAATADADPVWRCTSCKTAAPHWQPVCGACGKTGTVRWGAPSTTLAIGPSMQTQAAS